MIRKILYLPIRAIVILAGFVFIVNLPLLFVYHSNKGSIELHFGLFIETLFSNIKTLIKMDEISLLFNFFEGDGLQKYFYTTSILSISLLIVSVAGITIATSIMLLPPSLKKRLITIIDFSTAAPELLVFVLLQYLVIYVLRIFDIKLFQVYGFFNKEPYFIPIFIITFLPTVFLIQFLLKEFRNEEQLDYVLFARSKGLPYRAIYLKHMIRNIFPIYIIHLRTIIWFLLTTIFVVENLLHIKGYMEGLQQIYRESVVAYILGLFLFAIPIVIANMIAKIVNILIKKGKIVYENTKI